jgi:Xaa-Pro aminopeptidase
VGVSHLLVTNPKDVGYLTGFLGGDSYLVVPAGAGGARARPVVISDFRYQEELEPVRSIADVFIRAHSMSEAVGEVVEAVKVDRLGVQAEHLTLSLRQAVAKVIGARGIVETSALVAGLRIIKDEGEIKLIVKAARIQEAALKAVLPKIKAGQTELEVAARLEAEMKMRGSSEPGFQSIVAAGTTGSLPHYRPQARKIARGKSLLIDWGATYRGYHSDMTRVFALGKWPKKIAEIYKIVLDAQEMAAAALAPGKSTFDIDAIARKHITSHGYGEFYGHGLGHGLGLDGHVEPRLTHMLAPSILEPGHVVTVEPGIYLPGVGGVRIEDDYVITPTGARNLCTLPKSLDWATL